MQTGLTTYVHTTLGGTTRTMHRTGSRVIKPHEKHVSTFEFALVVVPGYEHDFAIQGACQLVVTIPLSENGGEVAARTTPAHTVDTITAEDTAMQAVANQCAEK
jgi:hypothetical protein